MIRSLRDEALRLLEGRGAILDVARDVSRVLREAEIDAAIIGGVAVVLHGHVRTTVDVDVFIAERTDSLKDVLEAAGYAFDSSRREFVRDGIPVHLVFSEQVQTDPGGWVELEGVCTVSLADLINMKLALGTRDPLRAQDLADVIGLIRVHSLGGDFASKIDKPLRSEFRKLAKAVRRES
jgi:Nucleotidyltransferase of unknown function (DUF6036)